MCKNAQPSIVATMLVVQASLKSLLSFLGLSSTPQGQAVLAAFDAALTAVRGWKNGTTAQNVIQLIEAFRTIFATLPLPITVELPVNVILGGIEAVIGILTANSPAPASAVQGENLQAIHAAIVAHETGAKIHALIPGLKLSRNHPEQQYVKAFNDSITQAGLPDSMKIAA